MDYKKRHKLSSGICSKKTVMNLMGANFVSMRDGTFDVTKVGVSASDLQKNQK